MPLAVVYGQFARVVKGVDLRSTAGNCAWVRTPQLTFLQRGGAGQWSGLNAAKAPKSTLWATSLEKIPRGGPSRGNCSGLLAQRVDFKGSGAMGGSIPRGGLGWANGPQATGPAQLWGCGPKPRNPHFEPPAPKKFHGEAHLVEIFRAGG